MAPADREQSPRLIAQIIVGYAIGLKTIKADIEILFLVIVFAAFHKSGKRSSAEKL